MHYVLGIDVGTTAVKTLLINDIGDIVAEVSAEHDLRSAHPGWAEEDAVVWWENVKKTIAALGRDYPQELAQVEAIGVSGMVPAIVLVGSDGLPVRNTIQQNDARAVKQIDFLTEAIDQEELYRRTGTRTNQQHVIPRMLWVKENEPDVFARAAWVTGSYEYVAYRFTGVRFVEMNWAVESGCFDIHTQQWISEQFCFLDVPEGFFPEAKASMGTVGAITAQAAAETGLREGIPVIAGSADHVASTLAAGIVESGDMLIKFGGAGDILYCTDEIETNEKLFFDYHIVPDRYLLNGCMASSGSLVKWYTRDILQEYSGSILQDLDREAEKLPAGSEGLIILPYFVGEKTPIFDPTARGVMFGLTLSHTRAHIFRAVLESVIYGFRHHADVLAEMGLTPKRVFATNGGAKSAFWCQIAADVLNSKIVSFPHHPGSALGVAFLAGMSAGLYDSWEDIQKYLQKGAKTYLPNPENVGIYDRAYKLYRELYVLLKDSFAEDSRMYEA